MSYSDTLLCIFGLFVVSYIPRILPFALLGNRELPRGFRLWLQYVPTAVFGALIFTSIFGTGVDDFVRMLRCTRHKENDKEIFTNERK